MENHGKKNEANAEQPNKARPREKMDDVEAASKHDTSDTKDQIASESTEERLIPVIGPKIEPLVPDPRQLEKQTRVAPSVQLPRGFRNPRSIERALLFQLVYSLAGLVLGLVCIIGGIVLFLNGIVGSTSWTARVLGGESHVSDAAPGVVLFIVGLFMVITTRFKITSKD